MVVLGGGIFTMGSPTSEDGHSYDEGPLRRITIAPFAVSRYEVTFDQWRACEAEGGCSRHATLDLSAIAPEFGVLPVVAISWEQAREYTQWLSQKTGQTYRLLSEAEWEYAARGGMTTRYSWGDDDPVCEAGAANGAAYGSYVASEACSEIQPVGSYQANDFGLYDMHGNAAEWVEDCYSATYFGRDAAASPNTWPDCWGHVVRGGSGFDLGSEWSVRSAYRSLNGESTAFIGFRVARDLQ
jgi:formylglycine-generating enzyme required for sulfatase activity